MVYRVEKLQGKKRSKNQRDSFFVATFIERKDSLTSIGAIVKIWIKYNLNLLLIGIRHVIMKRGRLSPLPGERAFGFAAENSGFLMEESQGCLPGMIQLIFLN